MKVSVIETKEVLFTAEDLLDQLVYPGPNGESCSMPLDATLSWREDGTDGYLIVTFTNEAAHGSPPDPEPPAVPYPTLSHSEMDVWGVIRAAGDEGITYKRLEAITGHPYGTLTRAVHTLVKNGLVKGEVDGGKKRWRSVP